MKHGNHSLVSLLDNAAPAYGGDRAGFTGREPGTGEAVPLTTERPATGEPEGVSPLSRLCQLNVMQQLDNLLSYPWLRRRMEEKELELVGLYLELDTAKVHLLDAENKVFVSVPDDVPDKAVQRAQRPAPDLT